MSYNQKPPGSSGSGMGGGPPNGPNNIPQVAKTLVGIQQQMQSLVHGQNAIQQSPQPDINAILQQQRIQNMIKQQQQILQFQQQMQQQQQQHQQQQHQHHNMAGGGGVGAGAVGGVPGVTGGGSGGGGGSGEPLALTRTAGAELLNKSYQQPANGNPAANPAFNQLQQTFQGFQTNFVQQLQAFQYQMQAKQMHQQQHGGGQGQHGHGQQQTVQGVPPPPPTSSSLPHQQQQQKHQNAHQQQQQQNVFTRYLTAAAHSVAVSSNKMSSATTPPPPLTNQIKPPNLPPNTQITPVTATNISGGNISSGPHPKMSTGNANTGTSKHSAPPPSISLTPSKSAPSGPSIAHQQNKFTPPTNSGAKGAHMGHLQNLPKSTHGASHTAISNASSSAKVGTNSDGAAAALKSQQSTPVQLTKQMPPMATIAALTNKTQASATTTIGATTTEALTTMVSLIKSTPSTTTAALAPTPINTLTNSAVVAPNITATSTITTTTNATSTKPAVPDAAKTAVEASTATKLPPKMIVEKETAKTSTNDITNPAVESTTVSNNEGAKKEIEKPKEKKLDSEAVGNKPTSSEPETKNNVKASNEFKSDSDGKIFCKGPVTAKSSSVDLKHMAEKIETLEKSSKKDNHDINENENKLADDKIGLEKNKVATADAKTSSPSKISAQDAAKQPESAMIDLKKAPANSNQLKNSLEEKKLERKEKMPEKDKERLVKSSKTSSKTDQLESVASKDVQKTTILMEKPIHEVEAKTTPNAKSTATVEHIPVNKPLKSDEINAKNSIEANNKKESPENDQKMKEEKEIGTVPDVSESIKSPSAGDVKENKKDAAPKMDDLALKEIMSEEKSEAAPSVNTTQTQGTTKNANTEDGVKDSAINAQKETATIVPTSVKKVGRLAKGVKSKSVAAATSASVTIPAENKATELQEDKPAASTARFKRKLKPDSSYIASDLTPSTPKDDDSDRKSKRHRLKTILYQSPLPELAYITKLSASEASNSPKPMTNEDRLIVFYKNEYMAVRNAEGTFYLCQTMQNVYRTSPRISIRWLSEDAKDNNVFMPDFYDHTDIECVLTTVELKRIDKGHLRLPKDERNRIESILKKAIDVEKGLVPRPELTEENPDGLDISLFKDESQIEKKTALTEGTENLTHSISSGRKSKRGATANRKSITSSATILTSSGNKRKRNTASSAISTSTSRKSLSKKRKTLTRRKKKIGNSDDDDEDESTDDYESDAEYKPTQKRSSLNVSGVSRATPRAQRSPLAKARAASPITPTTSRSKIVPQKTTPTPSTSKASRGERAAKRKSIIEVVSSEDNSTAAKKPTTTSNNKSKATDKHANEASPVKKSSHIDNSSSSSTS